MKPNISSMEKGRGHSSISNILLLEKRAAECYTGFITQAMISDACYL